MLTANPNSQSLMVENIMRRSPRAQLLSLVWQANKSFKAIRYPIGKTLFDMEKREAKESGADKLMTRHLWCIWTDVRRAPTREDMRFQ